MLLSRKTIAVGFFTIILMTSALIAVADQRTAQLDEFLGQCVDREVLNGSVLVAQNGEILYGKGFGYADIEWEIPNTTDTKFRLCSISKPFTAILVMQMAEEGKLKLSDKINDHLPEYREDVGQKVTIEHLLTHTSGIPNFTNGSFSAEAAKQYSMDQMIKEYAQPDPVFEPGSAFDYSNTGYLILSAILERVSGKSYEQLLAERIFQPLGMKNSCVENVYRIIPKRSQGYTKGLRGMTNGRFSDIRSIYGAGSVLSTPEDMLLLDQALYNNTLLSKKSREAMFTPRNYMESHKAYYGYGWEIDKLFVADGIDSLNVIFHDGGWIGYNTRFARLTDDRYTVVLFCNMDNSALKEIFNGIVDILYGQPYTLPKLSIMEPLMAAAKEGGPEAAIEKYRDLKANQANDYRFRETELNQLGYMLMAQGKLDDAMTIFKLNVDEYPESFNVYDSMGEAYMASGDKNQAIVNYAKSLELNPQNSNALEMLNRLMNVNPE